MNYADLSQGWLAAIGAGTLAILFGGWKLIPVLVEHFEKRWYEKGRRAGIAETKQAELEKDFGLMEQKMEERLRSIESAIEKGFTNTHSEFRDFRRELSEMRTWKSTAEYRLERLEVNAGITPNHQRKDNGQ